MSWVGMTGLLIVLVSAGLILGLSFFRRKTAFTFRGIASFSRLQEAVNRTVEEGSRLHVSLGHSGLISPQSASALAGLAVLRSLSDLSSTSDRPPIASSGDGGLTILSQDVLQASYQDATSGGHYDIMAGRLTGLTPFSYAAGTLPIMHDEQVSANVLLGNFGIEVGLLAETAERANSFALAASDNLPAQAVLYASAQDPLIGEELFAAGAYMNAGTAHHASLKVQDLLRWLIIASMLFGVVLAVLGWL